MRCGEGRSGCEFRKLELLLVGETETNSKGKVNGKCEEMLEADVGQARAVTGNSLVSCAVDMDKVGTNPRRSGTKGRAPP